MIDPGLDKQLEYCAACHSAILAWAKPQFDVIANQTIEYLKKQPAIGMFEDEYTLRNFWDEYSHEVQNGPFVQEWYDAVDAFCHGMVKSVDRPTLTLLSIAAIEEQFEDENQLKAGGVWPDLVVRVVMEAVNQAASEWDLDHFYRDFAADIDDDDEANDGMDEQQ